MANVVQIELEKVIKPLLREILKKLEAEPSTAEIVEVAAAKIISEIKKCDCNKEVFNLLQTQADTNIVERKENPGKLYQYSYPNNSVGNEELGTGKNPHSLTWPPKI